ncbi:unnamed protein product [Prorocentrum cordatum]|uniref:Uncharacterized protein n=1 Tax=Prorocentrum cordatum TaxID=2364126 RepID=A0ABN9Y6Z2_9DINO|nr:unnamed protein product [Polarella glacialis]
MFKNTYQSGFLSVLYSISAQAAADLGQEGPQRAHQAPHGRRHPVERARDHGHEREHHVHRVPRGPEADAGDQAAVPGDDHQEPEEVLHLRGHRARRQGGPAPLPRVELPEHHPREAVHLHHADAPGRGLEPDPIQPVRLHPACLRHELHRDPPAAAARELPDPQDLFLGQALQRGGAAPGVQALPARGQEGRGRRGGRGCHGGRGRDGGRVRGLFALGRPPAAC